MPPLPNIRQERFCRLVVRHGVASKAFKLAGYIANTRNTLDANSSRLMGNDRIKQRVAELRAINLHRSQVTMDKLLTDSEQARLLALELGQTGAALNATRLQGQLTGQLLERVEKGQPGDFRGLESQEAVFSRVRNEFGDDAIREIKAVYDALQRAKAKPPLLIEATPNSTAP